MFWQELKKQLRYMDGVLIVVLVLLSFSPYVVFAMTSKQQDFKTNETLAVVTIDGEVVDEFILGKNTQQQEKTYYPSKNQYNIVEIDGTKIRVREDNSPDQVAVKTGWIDQPGQVSICLPHRLMIEIKGVSADDDDVIISY